MDTSAILADFRSFLAFLSTERNERVYDALKGKMLFKPNQLLALRVLNFLCDAWNEKNNLPYIHPRVRLTILSNLVVGFPFIVIEWLRNKRHVIRISILFLLKSSLIYAKSINSCEIFRLLIRKEPYGSPCPCELWNTLMSRYTDSQVEARIYWLTITCTLINQNHLTDEGWRDLTQRVAILLSRELVEVRMSAVQLIQTTAEPRAKAEHLYNKEVIEFLCHRIGDKKSRVKQQAISAGGELYSAFMTLLNPRVFRSNYLSLLGSACLMQYKFCENEKERYLMEECLLEYIVDNRSDQSDEKAYRIIYFVTNAADQAVAAFANIIKNMSYRRSMLQQVLQDDLSKPVAQLATETRDILKILEKTFSYQRASISKVLAKVQSNPQSRDLLLKLISPSPSVSFEDMYDMVTEFVGDNPEDRETVLRDQLLVRCGCTLIDLATLHRLLARMAQSDESYKIRLASLVILFSLSHELFFQTEQTLNLLCQLPTFMQLFIISRRSLHKLSEIQCANLLAVVQQRLDDAVTE